MRIFAAMLGAVAALVSGIPGAAQPVRNHQIASPGTLVQIARDRTIHINCMGSKAPTVILTAGAGDSGTVWREIQPEVARTTRVCAWDRAGSGFSSKSIVRETVAETTSDLIAALKGIGIDGTLVVVGHSLGAYESLLLKDKAPEAVVGMVLVDPSIPDQFDRLNRIIGEPLLADNRVFSPMGVSSKLVVNPHRHYDKMPMIVLSSTKAPALPAATADAASVRKRFAAMTAEMHRGHSELASLSFRGARRSVPNSGHYIQEDQPSAVIRAIEEVVTIARAETDGQRQ
jgi:pimeloyl-ACP methyl ester carboxylesterase